MELSDAPRGLHRLVRYLGSFLLLFLELEELVEDP